MLPKHEHQQEVVDNVFDKAKEMTVRYGKRMFAEDPQAVSVELNAALWDLVNETTVTADKESGLVVSDRVQFVRKTALYAILMKTSYSAIADTSKMMAVMAMMTDGRD